jgi:plastocyanin
MTMPHAVRSALLVCVLCLVGVASTAIAIAAPTHRSRRRPSHAARLCHRAKHRHCPAARAGKGRHKHKRGAASKPSARTPGGGASAGSRSSAPWAAVPPSVGPGSTPGSGTTPPGSGSGAPPTETPTAPAGPARVEVTAEDAEAFRFVLSRPSVPAGKVIIEFVNHGQDEHNLHAVEPSEGSEAGSLPNTAPNAHPSLTLNLRHGSYNLFCSILDHEKKGMKATLVVN